VRKRSRDSIQLDVQEARQVEAEKEEEINFGQGEAERLEQGEQPLL
jgi:hypothetical protein